MYNKYLLEDIQRLKDRDVVVLIEQNVINMIWIQNLKDNSRIMRDKAMRAVV